MRLACSFQHCKLWEFSPGLNFAQERVEDGKCDIASLEKAVSLKDHGRKKYQGVSITCSVQCSHVHLPVTDGLREA